LKKNKRSIKSQLQSKILRVESRPQAIYQFFEAMGPERTIERLARQLKGMVDRRALIRMAKRNKWWDRAIEYDRKQLEVLKKENVDKNRRFVNIMVAGIDYAIRRIFFEDASGKIVSHLEIKSWKDMLDVVRIRDYLSGPAERDPSKLAEVGSLHMAIVNLIRTTGRQSDVSYIDAIAEKDAAEQAMAHGTPLQDSDTLAGGNLPQTQ